MGWIGPWVESLERVTGIEPAFSAWEADVLPLNYTRKSCNESAAKSNEEAIAELDPVAKLHFETIDTHGQR